MVQKQLVPLPIEAGVYTEETERGARGRWYRADKVRFRKGLAEKIGGWVQKQPQFLGVSRRVHDWISLDGKKWTAIATELKLYLWQNESLFDITPLRASGILTDPFDTVLGSAEVTVHHIAHSGQVGDFVRFANASAVGGITISGEYRIATADTDSYTIIHSAEATGTENGGGGTVEYQYDISAGGQTALTATGYSTGPYGREGYGNARTGSQVIIALRTWALDNWGEDLLANYANGALYYWDRTTGASSRAVLLENAPQVSQYMIISQKDRHVFALGAFDHFNSRPDPLLIRWNSTEDLNDWIPTTTNTAGDIRIYRGSKIVTAIRSRLETLVFTDLSVHSLIGQGSGIFGQNTLGENVSIVGPNAAVAIDHRVLFMADADFYIYDGILRVLKCDVRNFVYDNLNTDQKDKVYAGVNKLFNEVWWFYPSRDPNGWVQQDFTLGLPSGYSLASASLGNTEADAEITAEERVATDTFIGYFNGQDVLYGTLDSSGLDFFLAGVTYWQEQSSGDWFFAVFADSAEDAGTPPAADVFDSLTFVGASGAEIYDSSAATTDLIVTFAGDGGFPEMRRWTWPATGSEFADTDQYLIEFSGLSPAAGVIGYTYTFNSNGYVVAAGTAANGYEHDFVLTNDEQLLTPLESEYAVEIDINPDYANGPKYAGLSFLRTEISGTPNTNSDDAKQFMVELDFDGDAIRIRKKGPDGTIAAPDNQVSNSVDVTTLTGDALVADRKYIIKVQVDAPRIRVWLDGEQAFNFDMSAQELIDYPGGTAGLHVAADANTDGSYRFYNFAASPIGVITADDFDISPIEINRYVAVNYEEGTWTMGTLTRTAWHDKSAVLEKPYATGIDGFIYQHETGVDDNGQAMSCFIESYDMEIGDGEFLMHVDQLVPDFLRLEGSISVSLTGKKYPGAPRFSKGPYPVMSGTRKVSTRFRARQVAIKIASSAMGDRWRMSHWRGRAGAHGKRG